MRRCLFGFCLAVLLFLSEQSTQAQIPLGYSLTIPPYYGWSYGVPVTPFFPAPPAYATQPYSWVYPYSAPASFYLSYYAAPFNTTYVYPYFSAYYHTPYYGYTYGYYSAQPFNTPVNTFFR